MSHSLIDYVSRLWTSSKKLPKFQQWEVRKSFISSEKKKSYHLSLSGWALRGLAHIGIYKALRENGYSIASVEGTSMGALVGVFIAAKKTPQEIEKIFTDKSLYKLLPISFSGNGLLSLTKITNLLEEVLGYTTIESLPLPFTVCITDFVNEKPLYLSQGDIQKLIVASCAIPWVFDTIEYEDTILVDGWIFDNMPVSHSRGLPIIASHVNPRIFDKINPTKDIATRSIEMMMSRDVAQHAQECELFFEPQELTSIGFGLAVDRQKIIDIGYQHALSIIKDSEPTIS